VRTVAIITGIFTGVRKSGGGTTGIPKELFEKLCEIYPEGRGGSNGHSFTSNLSIDDPRTKAILELLDRGGMQPWKGRGECRMDSEYRFKLRRIYDDSDFEVCEYLELYGGYDPEIGVPGEKRVEGRTRTEINEPGEADICMISPGSRTHVAVQRARDALEAANLKGLQFLPVSDSFR